MMLDRVQSAVGLSAGETSVSVRRLVDAVSAGVGLLFAGPIMMLIALSIWIEDGRPIFFSQTRLGRHGRKFRIHKFRKFHKRSEVTNRAVTINGDDRMGRVGRFLERTKLDELPQLWNIFKGDMTIVGPRAESEAFAECFIGNYLRILHYTPGLFGPNQYLFRNEKRLYPQAQDPERFYREVLFPLKANIDLLYFADRTTRSDIGWILRGGLATIGLRMSPPKRLNGQLERELNRAVTMTVLPIPAQD
jgi:lipopolysaccharide/colanic/teichoic acid biosynthesis glycosyltransferase